MFFFDLTLHKREEVHHVRCLTKFDAIQSDAAPPDNTILSRPPGQYNYPLKSQKSNPTTNIPDAKVPNQSSPAIHFDHQDAMPSRPPKNSTPTPTPQRPAQQIRPPHRPFNVILQTQKRHPSEPQPKCIFIFYFFVFFL